MKKIKSNSTVSKLGESAYNALVLTNQVSGDDKRILQYSYNLVSDTEKGEFSRSFDDYSCGKLKRNSSMFRSERTIPHSPSNEGKQLPEKKKVFRSISNPITGRRTYGIEAEKVSERYKVKERFPSDGATPGVGEEDSSSRVLEATITENPETIKNDSRVLSRETHARKIGLGETTNTSIMSHKLRKKGVCDTTDNSHYQRQFLRVLNKRF